MTVNILPRSVSILSRPLLASCRPARTFMLCFGGDITQLGQACGDHPGKLVVEEGPVTVIAYLSP